MTIFADELFTKSELTTLDGKKKIICTLRDRQGKFTPDLVRQDSKGSCSGRMVEPVNIPDWCVPGTVLKGLVNGVWLTLTVEPSIPSRIAGLTDLLGQKIVFSYTIVSEFPNV